MIDERHVVTTESVLARGRAFRRTWISGWLFGTACLGIACYTLGLDRGRKESLADIQLAMSQVRASVSMQEKSTQAFIKAWENQNERFHLVESWANYVHDRADLANTNDGVIIPRPRWSAKRVVIPK